MAHPTADAPASLCELSRGEHMLLWAFRAAAFGAGRCAMVRRQFDDACGAMGAEAINALLVFVRELARQGRRTLSLSLPGSHRLARDEQLILAIFGSAQVEDYTRMEAHLAWLVGADEPPHVFGAVACLVAETFAMNGLTLRAPEIAAPLQAGLEPASSSDVVIPFRPRIAAG